VRDIAQAPCWVREINAVGGIGFHRARIDALLFERMEEAIPSRGH
jgi:hypothetical protein